MDIGIEPGNKKPMVLIVDDIPDNLYILGMALKKSALDIAVVSESRKTIEAVREYNPDLILLDILMPEMDGYQVCEELKKDSFSKDIPVIFLTARSGADDVIKGFKTGAADYIIKPFSIQEAIARIMTHIELKRQRDMNLQYIEQLKITNEKLSKAEKELIELNDSKDKFFSIISHDLRNPFQGFVGLTDLLVADYDEFTKDELRGVLENLNFSAHKLNKLLENLLTWAKLQIGRIEFSPIKLNARAIAKESVDVFSELITDKNITVQIDIPESQDIVADKFMLETILRNIISNAVKFTFRNGVIHIRFEEYEGRAVITIADSGIGMTQNELDKLFKIDKNHTRVGTNNETGTGLGLILCMELAEKNNGIIEVKSKKGEGTAFSLVLNNTE